MHGFETGVATKETDWQIDRQPVPASAELHFEFEHVSFTYIYVRCLASIFIFTTFRYILCSVVHILSLVISLFLFHQQIDECTRFLFDLYYCFALK